MLLQHDPDQNGWQFETELLKGFLLPFGARHGVKTLVHKPTGIDVVHERYDLLNLFLLFSTNLCMKAARDYDRTARQEGDGVVVDWPAAETHRCELQARYTFREPNLIDLEVTVRSQWVYPAYELFLSNYFPPTWQPHVYVQGCQWARGQGADEWIAPVYNDVFAGTGLVFPRDQHASVRSTDGRWNRIWALYQWNPQRYYAKPVMYQADPERKLAAVMMSRPEHAFAAITGYDSDDLTDPFKDQNPLYFSLFGDDLLIGTERTVKVRLAVIELDAEANRPLELYEEFLAETA